MSRLLEALRRSEMEVLEQRAAGPTSVHPRGMWGGVRTEPAEFDLAHSPTVQISPAPHLVALTDPQGLGAEKFRALTTRLDNLRKERELKFLQVTSSMTGEGKTLVTGNLAVSLAKCGNSKILLIEGDLRRPRLASLFGLSPLSGLSEWWPKREEELARFLRRLNDLSVWVLTAGKPYGQPSDILQSTRFAEALALLGAWFDWVVVDSTPLLPMVDASLWSRLVDGTLLVVREGTTPVKVIKKSFECLDNPKLIGVVLNEASGLDQANYRRQYYAARKQLKKSSQGKNKTGGAVS
jgi:capsular exopolysaccharide synthesis family protein